MARSIHNMMIHIADPRQCYGLDPAAKDMLFPDASGIFLHDLFVAHQFIRGKDSKNEVVLLRDAKAWEYVNTRMELPPDAQLYCGLWYKETEDGQYRFHSASDRVGDIVASYSKSRTTEEFCDFDMIRVMLIRRFIKEFDMDVDMHESSSPIVRKEAKNPVTTRYHHLEKVSPSDYVQTPVRKSGNITQTEREFCNDADSGYMTYTYRRYTTFYIQVRWCVRL
jgi:hypothetical protein